MKRLQKQAKKLKSYGAITNARNLYTIKEDIRCNNTIVLLLHQTGYTTNNLYRIKLMLFHLRIHFSLIPRRHYQYQVVSSRRRMRSLQLRVSRLRHLRLRTLLWVIYIQDVGSCENRNVFSLFISHNLISQKNHNEFFLIIHEFLKLLLLLHSFFNIIQILCLIA